MNGRAVAMAAALIIVSASGSLAANDRGFNGTASYYSADYHGAVASGAKYDPEKFTAAHKTLPFGTRLRVTDPKTGNSVVVIVNDRGPFTKGLMLDLSLAAAKKLHMLKRGILKVRAEIQ
ncbi:MAG: septal ring lytic transglycosylase RlpA family protein [Pseudolabrys sp.]